jgi:DNA-binding transcriptional ArsR family regulator
MCMIDPLVAVYILLFLLTACISLIYYLRVRQASKEYMKARGALDDIVFSFDKELRAEGDRIREIAQKNDMKIAEALDAVDRVKPKVTELEERLKRMEESMAIISNDQRNLKKRIDDSLREQAEPLKETILASVGTGGHESDNLTIPPIPLRKERALASLTDTEVQILELLAHQGERTAVQIQSVVKLTREHTARLMKKLYISGYVERRTDRTPYTYRLKKEMEGLLDMDKP